MKKWVLFVVAIVSALLFSGCAASVDDIGQEQDVSTSMSTQASTSAVSSASTQSTLTTTTISSTTTRKKSTTTSTSSPPVSGFPKIDEDPQLIRPSAIAKSGRYLYTQNQISEKRNLLKIDTGNQTYTALTDFSVGCFLLVNESVYYTAGNFALYVFDGTNTRMLTNKRVGLFWAYKNKLYLQTKESEEREEYTLYRMNLDGQGIMKLATGPSVITIFHDRIYYMQGMQIYSMATDGTDIQPLYNFQGGVFSVGPDALYYFEDHPAPRGMELYRQTISGAITRLCSAPGYMYDYSTDHYLYYMSTTDNTVRRMRLDGTSAQVVKGIPENLLCYNVFDNVFYAWNYDNDSNGYFSWTDVNTHRALGKVWIGKDEMYQPPQSPTPTEPTTPIQPWESPYNKEKIVQDSEGFAISYHLTVVDDVSPDVAAGKWVVSTYQTKGDAKKEVFQRILTIAAAGMKKVGIQVEPDKSHTGDYLIYILYNF